ncbi:MAG: RsmB/NOP family class I SAM-dependent RNA methyltransferase [Mesorhizobium sp.]|nr:RsmB/NOP family class I SAM-dependent RNA methyltransferase [Mesorhizobium sp.]
MRLGGRLAAAIEVLDDMEARHRPASEALRDWGLSHRFAGAGDRAAIGNIVYDALRRKRSAAWLLDAETSRALALGALVLEWGMTPAQIDSQLEGDRFAPALLDDAEKAALADRNLDQAPDAVRADCPDWCVPLFEQAFGPEWVKEAAALAARPPLDLRVNTLAASRDKVLAELAPNSPTPSALARNGIRIPPIEAGGRHPNVQSEPAFRKGWFEIQDTGSQLAAEIAGAEISQQVLDYCAGAGGKTLAMAAAMENRGQIFAFDAEKQRLAPIFDRLKRAGTRNVQAFADPARLTALEGQLDLVLVDAPCTGSGTWRRRPDAKWRVTDRQLELRLAEQAEILEKASRYVKPGGRLAYVTCSVFPSENEEQVAAFLEQNPDFVAEDHAAIWAARFPGKEALARFEQTGGIVMTPARTGTDGFFVALLRKAG